MNNLLRTLTEFQTKQSADLKLLLTTVKEARRQTLETKLSDPFYESLEGLLVDLRTVTVDNRDAEAFLKPVSRTEYPDYYDVIATPMDLQTMLKKVKAKSYKSKREFQDDLDLIWSNCFLFNAVENHPLRLCVMRLKAKAERLLKYVTDRKDRADPHIPGEMANHGIISKVNGTSLNGVVPGLARPRSIQSSKSPSPAKLFADADGQSRKDVPFQDSLAIVRTQAGMTTFRELDRELDERLAGMQLENEVDEWTTGLESKLKAYGSTVDEDEDDGDGDVSLKTHDGDIGEKRKLNGYVDNRPRKRARTSSENVDRDVVDLWWDAMRSDDLIGNGLPVLLHARSDPLTDDSHPHKSVTDPSHPQLGRQKKKRKKKAEVAQPWTLLYHMNNNIKTMRKVRTTHAKFSELDLTNEDGNVQPSEFVAPPADDVEEAIDEKPWRTRGSGLEIGPENADDCLHWAGTKILEHAGFQGASKMAMDVLASVASDFFSNVGRTITFLSAKHADRMSPEEIILHTLFESGIAKAAELERYVSDDILKYGARLSDLEKKLANAYTEATTVEAWDDDALFKMDGEEEEDGEFVMGNFADSLGDDFLGLRELGIAAEFGLSTLSIPKKLLKGKNKVKLEGPASVQPSEPPLPFPLPPPFIPIDSENVESQIGLLKPFYQSRISDLAAQQQPMQHPPLPPQPPFIADPNGAPSIFGYPVPYPPAPPPDASQPQPLPHIFVVLPDDPPSPAHTKIGPLGQIVKPSTTTGSKKKSKAKPKAEGGDGLAIGVPDGYEGGLETPVMTPYAHLPSESPKKPKGGGGGPGSAKKKAAKAEPPLPPVVMASA
ncbi:Transcriptional activator spt7 [Steccherinum ochraceum]|uniref:Transcriptional activator spt7 n=1 Tax=Steccherinum ochraceum TaxID=92696 RepID=A0A4R0RJT6_9APHY|nr:Transcriptional activator spt7 [Steccherinum ochraceum]